jgi:DNA-binding HxlR family transcriptional regulator
MKRRQRRSDCPVHFALEVFGDPWTLLIIRDLMFKGRTRYTDFLSAEEGIATNVLADRLSRLEQDGVIEKEAAVRGSSGSYRLTPKGVDLLPIMIEIIAWSARYDPRTAADRSFVRRARRDREGLLTEIRAQLTSTGRHSSS